MSYVAHYAGGPGWTLRRASAARRSGDGGQGEIVQQGKGKTVPNFKYKPGGHLPKMLFLPTSE